MEQRLQKFYLLTTFAFRVGWATLLLTFFAQSCEAQSSQINNLYQQLTQHEAKNSERLKILLKIAEAQELSNPDKGINAADEAEVIAQGLKMNKERAIALNQKARLLMVKQLTNEANRMLAKSIQINREMNNVEQLAENDLTTAQFIICQRKADSTLSYIDKSYQKFKDSGNNFVLGKIYFFYGAHYGFHNTDTAQVLIMKSIQYFQNCKRDDWLALATFYLATNYTSLNENEKALTYFKIVENINREIKSDFIGENLYCTKGYLYFSLGDFPNAMNNFIPGLKIAEKINDEVMQACLLGNLGSVFGSIKDYKKSLQYINKQIAIAQKIGDDFTLCFGYQNLGWLFYDSGDYSESLKNFNKALELSLKIKQYDSMAECYGNLGDLNGKLGNYKEAFVNLKKALSLNREQGNYANISDNLLALSTIIENSGKSELPDGIGGTFDYNEKRIKASEFATEALRIADNKNLLTLKRDALKRLSEIYDSNKNHEESLKYYKMYVEVKDSIINSENIKTINNIQLKFDTEKKEQQINLLTKQSSLQQLELQKQSTFRNIFIIAFVLSALLSVIIYSRYMIKKKTNLKIERTLTHLKNTQEQLIESEKLASLGKLTAEVAKEIDTPIRLINNLGRVNATLLNSIKNNESIKEQSKSLNDNLFLINRYGKDADAIVKKVLIESRRTKV